MITDMLGKLLSQNERMHVGRCRELCRHRVQTRMQSPMSVCSMERCPLCLSEYFVKTLCQ